MANDIAIFRKVVYPPRGVIYDRNSKPMCFNEVIFDLMVTPHEIQKDLDTASLCHILDIDNATYNKIYAKTVLINGYMRQGIFMPQLSEAQTARFQENMYAFPGYQLVQRSIRSYPAASAGIWLGYIGEVSPAMLEKERFSSYQSGDFVGLDGLELTYEEVLRGIRGIYYLEKDNFNRPRDSYKRGALDTPAVAGRSLQLYTDAALQVYGEQLMQNKLGSIVAIEPSTGGIITMVSSPGYDPNLLKGNERSKNFAALYKLATKPLYNRAIKATYSPGSTQKPMTGIIALDANIITPSFGYPCRGGYSACGRFIACTEHWAGHAANFRLALANSCNSYFCNLYRLTVDNPKWGGVKKGLEHWYQQMYNFGFGHPTGIDLPYENSGTVYDSTKYNKMYRGVWNSCTNVFIGMGQGELSVTPLQMANAMCIIANHGYYYLPHFVKAVGNNEKDTVLNPYLKKHQVTHVADTIFELLTLAMQDVVEKGTARIAKLDGIDICAKTGTVENYALVHGVRVKLQNHSMFVAFAPREHPRIAIAVSVENAGFGATWAGPIASLMIEKYLNDTIAAKRKPLEEKMLKGSVINKFVSVIDSEQRAKYNLLQNSRIMFRQQTDSLKRAQDSTVYRNWLNSVLRKNTN